MFSNCPYCKFKFPDSDSRPFFRPYGSFNRKNDGVRLKRFKCLHCHRVFSEATNQLTFAQKKRHLNPTIFKLMASALSQRRLAKVLNINRKTVVRKFNFIADHGKLLLDMLNNSFPEAHEFQFDDMETFEHTKLKPVSILVVVEKKTRRIIAAETASMRAKGLLAKKAMEKYGRRPDNRKKVREATFLKIQKHVHQNSNIESDQNPHYEKTVKKYFPRAAYKQHKGRRGCVVGYGELKAGGFDPLFSLNHTCAMFRDGLSRLKRKTWTTTKKIEQLQRHLNLYAIYHNLNLIKKLPMSVRTSGLIPIFE